MDEWSLFIAPRVLGSGMPAFGSAVAPVFRPKEQQLGLLTAVQVGPDVLLRGFREKYQLTPSLPLSF